MKTIIEKIKKHKSPEEQKSNDHIIWTVLLVLSILSLLINTALLIMKLFTP